MRTAARASLILRAGFVLLGAASCNSRDSSTASARQYPMPQPSSVNSMPVAADTTVADFATAAAPSAAVFGGSMHKKATAVVSSPSTHTNSEAERTPALPQVVTPGGMLVRVGNASLQVDSLEIGIARVREVARRTNAIIANTSVEGGRQQTRAATLELRIPSEHFDEAVNGLSPIGKLESVSVSVQDVGEEFVDVQARMTNAKRLEQRLIELLANRTGKLSDVLTVERELARVREEIERYEGRLRYLRTRASVSTLSIAVHEPFPIVADRPGASPIRDAFVEAWRNFVSVTAGIIASLGVILPLGLILGALVLVGRRVLPVRTPKSARVERA